MSDEIRAGDVVRLKSSKTPMTVRWVAEEQGELTVFCDWIDTNGAHSSARFFPVQLKIAGEFPMQGAVRRE